MPQYSVNGLDSNMAPVHFELEADSLEIARERAETMCHIVNGVSEVRGVKGPSVLQEWRVRPGPYAGIGGGRSAMIDGRSTIGVRGDGGLQLRTNYNPPGSCLMAIGATIVTAIIVVAIAAQGTPCAGPGLLIWYVIFKYSRRKPFDLDLATAQKVVIDNPKRRIAVLAEVHGVPRWLGFRFSRNAEALGAAVEAFAEGDVAVESGLTKRTDRAVWILLFILIGLGVGLIVLAIVNQ